eukprot:4506491-Pleurochrysis_carterae.AAC.10
MLRSAAASRARRGAPHRPCERSGRTCKAPQPNSPRTPLRAQSSLGSSARASARFRVVSVRVLERKSSHQCGDFVHSNVAVSRSAVSCDTHTHSHDISHAKTHH